MNKLIFSLFSFLLSISIYSQNKNYLYLKGEIEKYPITIILYLNKEFDSETPKFHGYYYYDSKQIPIELFENNTEDSFNLILSSYNTDDEKQETFFGNLKNGIYKGVWKKDKTSLPFKLILPENNSFIEMIQLENQRKVPIITSKNDKSVEGLFEYKFTVPKNTDLQKDFLSKVYKNYSDFNSFTNQSLDKMATSYTEEITSYYKEYGEIRPSFSYQFGQFITPYLDSEELLIMRFSTYEYTGGAHGMSYQVFYNYDKLNKKWLEIDDVLDISKKNKINEILDKELRKKYNLGSDSSYQDAEGISFLTDKIELSENFTLSKNGITFHYGLYEMTPYAYGYFELFVAFDKLKPYLNKNFKY